MSACFKPPIAMVLAAGLGTRMRPVTNILPKPLVKIGDRTLLDYTLDSLVSAGVSRAIVNVHYLADMIEDHVQTRDDIDISISDEREELLETGGGVKKARALLGNEPFLTMNTDSFWLEHIHANMDRLFEHWDSSQMDVLMLLVPLACALGFTSQGDFELLKDGRVQRINDASSNAYIYSGVAIHSPHLFDKELPAGPFSLNLVWQDVLKRGRLYGVPFQGSWLHVGEPAMIDKAERYIRDLER